jgi:hypothetical protein
MGGWVGPTTGLEVLENRKISCPCWDPNTDEENVPLCIFVIKYKPTRCIFSKLIF